ncbi:MAG: 3-deoxy-manno-octulosonate cytidylyltransferase [Gemmatimonadaceae bacterium]|nr:3-deoxy-manno-octulosonate cytidylyltransferase [Gemmatimonadaceae bacterium]
MTLVPLPLGGHGLRYWNDSCRERHDVDVRVTVLAIIPARRGATRLHDKPLRLLGGVPLIVRVWQRVLSLGIADRVVVATDDIAVQDVIRAAGGLAVLTRADHPSGTDRVAEVARHAEFADASVVLNVQGDEPFVDADAIRGAVALVAGGRASIGTAAAQASPAVLSSPDCVKVVCDDTGRALYFSRAPIPYLRDRADEAVQHTLVRQHLGLYAYTREALESWVRLPVHPLELVERLEQLRPLAAGVTIGVAMARPVAIGGIDTEADLVRANVHWNTIHTVRSSA